MKKEKKQKKMISKAKRIRGIVMMTLLCVLMLSAATYAWFTLSNTAKVSNLTMTVGEATGLQIAKDLGTGNPGKYGSTLEFGVAGESGEPTYKIEGKLLPATTADGIAFKKPKYDDDGKVSELLTEGVDKLDNTTSDTAEGYYYETTFYMKALGTSNVDVSLKAGSSLPETGIAANPNTASGTYVLAKNGTTPKSGYLGSQAIRISLTDGTNTLVYEPNYNLNGTDGTKAEDLTTAKTNCVATTSKQDKNGSWEGSQSTKLHLLGNQNTKITMRIWIEGSDDDCVNEISLNDIIAQLQFATETP